MSMNKKLGFTVVGVVAVLGLVLSCSPAVAAEFNFPDGGGDYTIVEADPFLIGGTAGNTTAVGGGGFSSFAFNSSTWQERTASGLGTGYAGVAGATDRLFETSNGAPDLVTTITGLTAGTYEVSVLYMHGVTTAAQAGLLANLYGSTNSAFDRHFYDLSDAPTPVGTAGASFAIGLASLGTTAAGSTSFTVNIGEDDTGFSR